MKHTDYWFGVNWKTFFLLFVFAACFVVEGNARQRAAGMLILQGQPVRGQVLDSGGSPLPGVTVVIKKTTRVQFLMPTEIHAYKRPGPGPCYFRS